MTATLTTLVSFNGSNGARPAGGLIADANGDLFGTTEQGGAFGSGTVFEIQNTGTVAEPVYANTPTTLVSFNGSNGFGPEGLTADANGDLFGTTYSGGANNYGTVFEIQNTGTVAEPVYANTPTTLVSFNGSNGALPAAGLIADARGDLFGTTTQGGAFGSGTVFEIQNTGTVAKPVYASAPTTLVSFNGGSDGGNPGPLTADARGDLFGMTGGGAYGDGTVFEIQNTGTVAEPVYANTPTTLVSFNGSNGASPRAALTADARGDLLGTTYSGGANNYGTVFEIQNTGTVAEPVYANTPTTLVSFNGYNGALPAAGLIADARGDLFGTTEQGGAGYPVTTNGGTVFEIQNTGTVAEPVYANTPTMLVSFDGSNGFGPEGLTADANGDLFSTTEYGSGIFSGAGTVFEITDSGFVVSQPVLSFIGPVIHAAADTAWPVTISGLGDETGTLVFSDTAGDKVSVNITGNGEYQVNLSTLKDGSIASTLSVSDETNSQSVSGGPLTLVGAALPGSSHIQLPATSTGNLGTVGGNGPSVIDGSQTTNVAFQTGNGPDTIVAGVNDVVHAGTGSDTLVGANGATLYAGSGPDILYGAPGAKLVGGSGPDTFAFEPGFGKDTISNFHASNEVLQFNPAVFASYSAMVSADAITQSGANTIITDPAGDTVTLTGVAASSLTAHNFHFA